MFPVTGIIGLIGGRKKNARMSVLGLKTSGKYSHGLCGGGENSLRTEHFIFGRKKIDFSGPFVDLLFSRETGISRTEKPVFRKEKHVSRKELL